MFNELQRLLEDFSFLLKVQELIVACVCLDELRKYNEYTIPRWLWVVYCIDTSTYAIIYVCIGMTHIFQKPRRYSELTYFSIGAVFHLIGAIAGFVRSSYDDPEELEITRSELKIGLLLFGNFIVLSCEAAHIAYTEFTKPKRVSVSPVQP